MNKQSKKSDWPDFWNNKKIYVIHTQIVIGKFSNSLKVIGFVRRKDVNGIGVVVWIEIVKVERKENDDNSNNNHQLK